MECVESSGWPEKALFAAEIAPEGLWKALKVPGDLEKAFCILRTRERYSGYGEQSWKYLDKILSAEKFGRKDVYL